MYSQGYGAHASPVFASCVCVCVCASAVWIPCADGFCMRLAHLAYVFMCDCDVAVVPGLFAYSVCVCLCVCVCDSHTCIIVTVHLT